MRKIAILGAILLGFGTAPARAVTLVNQTGRPIGQYQTWADAAEVPTVAGPLTIQAAGSPSCPLACSASAGDRVIQPDGTTWIDATSQPTTWLSPDVWPWAFYFELGHQFDWQYLTDADRQQFAVLWQATGSPWWDSQTALDAGWENGLEAAFAADYAWCALGDAPQGEPGWVRTTEPPDPQAVCRLVVEIGQQPPPAVAPAVAPAASPIGATTRPAPAHRRRQRVSRTCTGSAQARKSAPSSEGSAGYSMTRLGERRTGRRCRAEGSPRSSVRPRRSR